MKIGILHLTDIHIQDNKDPILGRVDKIVSAVSNKISGVFTLFIVVSGDLANKGKKSEYEIARIFLTELSEKFRSSSRTLKTVEFILVPGNHDCNFSEKDAVRETLLSQPLGDDTDSQIIEQCLSVQHEYWKFYKSFLNKEKFDISSQITFKIKLDKDIIFNCYNTSWGSKIDEKVGSLTIPESSFLNKESQSKTSLVISVFHHPTNWLSPNTDNNNKKSFESLLLGSSSLVLCGHEHTGSKNITNSLVSKDGFIYVEGKALQNRYD